MPHDTSTSTGLEGVVAATTRLSHVDGEAGELVIAGFPVGELAANATFEETTWLLWHGELPSEVELGAFRAELAAHRALPPATLALLRECARTRVDHMDALRIALGTVSLRSSDAVAIVALAPSIVAAYARLVEGAEPTEPRNDLGHAANYLYMLSGAAPDSERVRALETYLNTVIDHGLNASTFTCRVIISTGSDLVSAVVGAVGALKGPLHGGAPGPALETVFEIGDATRAERVLRRKIEAYMDKRSSLTPGTISFRAFSCSEHGTGRERDLARCDDIVRQADVVEARAQKTCPLSLTAEMALVA